MTDNDRPAVRVLMHVSDQCMGHIIDWDHGDCEDDECECDCHFEGAQP